MSSHAMQNSSITLFPQIPFPSLKIIAGFGMNRGELIEDHLT